jgi:hypothetical protein
MSAPRIPNSEQYWIDKGKVGKSVVIYFHDDLDGIFSAIAIRNYLKNKGFTIVGYGVVNYIDGWKEIEIHNEYINVAVDFAETHPDMDVYIDHHGEAFGSDNTDFAIKTRTSSAYEGILQQLGIAQHGIALDPIDMIDSAKYPEYGLSFRDTMYYDLSHFTRTQKPKLHYTAAMNQFMKRGCWKTLIDVVHNTSDVSVYQIFNNFKKYYPGNNDGKDYVDDGRWRLGEVRIRTRGDIDARKPVFGSQFEFVQHNQYKVFKNGNTVTNLFVSGYQIIGNMCFVPSGTWANAIRARAILEEDIEKGVVPENQVKFILLQYGATLQMVCYEKINEIPEDELPLLKSGERVKNLGKYMADLLENMKEHLDYTDPSTYVGSDDDITVAGGHGGIGTISNIVGKVTKEGNFKGTKFLDLIKNKIIQDISGAQWNNLKMTWSNKDEKNDPEPINRFMFVNQIRTNPDDRYDD